MNARENTTTDREQRVERELIKQKAHTGGKKHSSRVLVKIEATIWWADLFLMPSLSSSHVVAHIVLNTVKLAFKLIFSCDTITVMKTEIMSGRVEREKDVFPCSQAHFIFLFFLQEDKENHYHIWLYGVIWICLMDKLKYKSFVCCLIQS